jgi:hypothetical protein
LFQQDAIFFLEVFDDSLLVSAHPAGDRDKQQLELRRHRAEWRIFQKSLCLNPPSDLG